MSEPLPDPRLRVPALGLPSPLPARRLVQSPPIEGARIKERAGDFLLEELQLYDPSGEGEHLYLRIVKEGVSHHELVDVLCAHFDVAPGAIGHAGMKDRAAVTSQTVSIHLPHRPTVGALQDPRLQVLWATWHANKLRRGHLAGNRFSIRIRGIEPVRATSIWRSLGELHRAGVPNHFGPQRFGMRLNGHVLGALLLCGRHEELLGELLSTRGSPFPESERAAREAVDAGLYHEALRLWPRGLDAEYVATRALHRGADARAAVRAVHRDVAELWTDAWQSAVFNRLLDERLAVGTFGAIEPGDIASKHANGARFLADEAAFAATGDDSLASRAARLEISATGPLPGAEAMRPLGGVLERECRAISSLGVDPARLGLVTRDPQVFAPPISSPDVPPPSADAPPSGRIPPGDRRPFRIALANPEIDAGFDEHGTYVRVAFDLPPGAYATVVLRELLGDALVDASRDAARS